MQTAALQAIDKQLGKSGGPFLTVRVVSLTACRRLHTVFAHRIDLRSSHRLLSPNVHIFRSDASNTEHTFHLLLLKPKVAWLLDGISIIVAALRATLAAIENRG